MMKKEKVKYIVMTIMKIQMEQKIIIFLDFLIKS